MRGYFFRKCDRCGGDGVAPGQENPEDPCTQCDGEGYYPITRLNVNVLFSYEIADALDITEYNALSAKNKASLHIILSLVFVSLIDGTNSRATLWSLFDENSTTRANLIALLDVP